MTIENKAKTKETGSSRNIIQDSKLGKWIKSNFIEFAILFTLSSTLIYGICVSGFQEQTLARFFTRDAGFISTNYYKLSFIEIGIGNSIIMASLFGWLHYGMAKLYGAKMDVMTFMGIFMVAGFFFVLVNIFSYLALLAGIQGYALLRKKKIKDLFVIFSLGTSSAALMPYLGFADGRGGTGFGWWGILIGLLIIIFIGFILPELALLYKNVHEGYSLANLGIAAAIPTIITWTVVNSVDRGSAINGHTAPMHVGDEMTAHIFFMMFIITIALLCIASLFWSFSKGFRGFWHISKSDGKFPSDFVDKGGVIGALINILALLTFLWALNVAIVLIGTLPGFRTQPERLVTSVTSSIIVYGPNSGSFAQEFAKSPIFMFQTGCWAAATIFQVFAFGVLGKQMMSAIFITLGILISYYGFRLIFGTSSITSITGNLENGLPIKVDVYRFKVEYPDVLIAIIGRAWLLSPVIRFGWHMAIFTGMLHFFVVKQSGEFHGTVHLYNTGFSTLFTVPVIIATARVFSLDEEYIDRMRQARVEAHVIRKTVSKETRVQVKELKKQKPIPKQNIKQVKANSKVVKKDQTRTIILETKKTKPK